MTLPTADLLTATQSAVLHINEDSDHDSVATAITMMDRLKAEVKKLDTLLKSAAIEWMKVGSEDRDGKQRNVIIGDVRYYVGKEKKVTCPDNGFAFSALLLRYYGVEDFGDLLETSLTDNGGDMAGTAETIQDAVMGTAAEVLGSGAIKPGAAKKILGDEDFLRFFKTEVVEVIEEGKAPRVKEVLASENEAFLLVEVRRARKERKEKRGDRV